MIRIIVNHQYYQYDAYHLVKAFYPNEKIESKLLEDEHEVVKIFLEDEPVLTIAKGQLAKWDVMKDKKHEVNVLIYDCLATQTNKVLDWGILLGIRPTKIFMKLLEQGLEEEEILERFRTYYLIGREKATLGLEIAKREKQLLSTLDYENGYSLYIGIPFCKTRCSYCSFTAYPLHKWEHRLDEYLDALLKELSFVAEVSSHKKLNTVYIGGGTPTSLTAAQLDRLLEFVVDNFDLKDLQEFTVEAGRPDTITKEKLEVMKRYPIDRISINPQTMQDKTLKVIGRNHSVEEIYQVYHMARELGFDNINMDMIVGLGEETLEDVEDTLRKILALEPDNLTVHALAMKRASILKQSGEKIKEASQMKEMIELSRKYAVEHELYPYYLYRQKNIAGNYENVG